MTVSGVYERRQVRRGQLLSQRATAQLLALELTLRELAAAGDPERLSFAVCLAVARLDFHFAQPLRPVLEEWDVAA